MLLYFYLTIIMEHSMYYCTTETPVETCATISILERVSFPLQGAGLSNSKIF